MFYLAMFCVYWGYTTYLGTKGDFFSSKNRVQNPRMYYFSRPLNIKYIRMTAWWMLDDCLMTAWWLKIKVALSQKVQDSFFIANFAIINIPFCYPKLLHPLHSIDKMSIFKTFTFTCLVYLQVQKVGFMSSTNNLIS